MSGQDLGSRPLQLVEIIHRAAQGFTRPFLCRAEDDQLYFVKGVGAGRRSLLCEWLAGHLGQALGLPIPRFAVVQASDALVALHPEGRDLGSAPAFGSLEVPHAMELNFSHIASVEPQLRRDVLIFDWWIQNADRTLSARGGNPNLLWSAVGGGLTVIDHNNAFDRGFDPGLFRASHAFSRPEPSPFFDLAERADYPAKLQNALHVWPQACAGIPEEWWFEDVEQTVAADFSLEAALQLLMRCGQADFWDA